MGGEGRAEASLSERASEVWRGPKERELTNLSIHYGTSAARSDCSIPYFLPPFGTFACSAPK